MITFSRSISLGYLPQIPRGLNDLIVCFRACRRDFLFSPKSCYQLPFSLRLCYFFHRASYWRGTGRKRETERLCKKFKAKRRNQPLGCIVLVTRQAWTYARFREPAAVQEIATYLRIQTELAEQVKTFVMGSHSFCLSPVAHALYCGLKWHPISVTVPSEMCSYLLVQACPCKCVQAQSSWLVRTY